MIPLLKAAYKVDKLSTLALITLSLLRGALQFFYLLYSGTAIDSVVNTEGDSLRVVLIFLLLLLGIQIIRPFLQRLQRGISASYRSKIEYRIATAIRATSVIDAESPKFQKALDRYLDLPNQFQKSLPMAAARLANTVRSVMIVVLVAQKSWGILVIYIGMILVSTLVKQHQHGSTHDFWMRYRERAQEYNLLSQIMIDKRYAHERILFDTTTKINSWFSKAFDRARRENGRAGQQRMVFDLSVEVIGKSIVFASYLLWLRHLFTGQLSFGFFFVMIALTFSLQEIIGEELSQQTDFHDFADNAKQLATFAQGPAAPVISPIPAVAPYPDAPAANLVLENVTFQYPSGEAPAIHDLSFTFDAGKTYVIVGKNGAGKSTLVKLLMGLYVPDAGSVILNGEAISGISDETRNTLFAAMLQSPNIYPLTLLENITIGNLGKSASEENILTTVDTIDGDLARAITALPNGLRSEVDVHEDGAVNLSGGQWQKLFFARLSQSEAPILILDEPTSNLDPLAEVQLYENITHQLKASLNILISHRLGIIQLADQILVLDEGQLLETGTHADLISQKGLYYDMYNAQKKLYADF